ncbi:hypothetical protein ATW55_07170 [Ferroacidibacillus organovorans]|uniref:Uncharacterized protein n=1 Tax=Ferroacidibacillus organovorans TaxID=1765683 RepID=A0A101XSY9_9BACL|nr:hypothetical protein ATW55_07170 [Ferroacidibacillus organovorans]
MLMGILVCGVTLAALPQTREWVLYQSLNTFQGLSGKLLGASAKPTVKISARMPFQQGGSIDLPALHQNITTAIQNRVIAPLIAAVPELTDVYIVRQVDGGLSITATGALPSYAASERAAEGIAARFLLAAYRREPYRIDFAQVDLESNGRYVLAAGLGDLAAHALTVPVSGGSAGMPLAALTAFQRDTGPISRQGFAQYSAP